MASRGWNDVTEQDARAMGRRQVIPAAGKPVARRSKYRAVRTVVDGFTFDSKAEARRYSELLRRGFLGYVRNLELQPWWYLTVDDGTFPGAAKVIVGKYIADFRYEERDDFDGAWEDRVEDVKGFKTPLYRWKKKHVEAQYGIQIQEIR